MFGTNVGLSFLSVGLGVCLVLLPVTDGWWWFTKSKTKKVLM